MDIKVPKFRIVRPQHASIVAEELVKGYLKWAVIISPLAFWKIWDLIKGFIK